MLLGGWVGGWLGSKALLVEEEGDTTAWVLKKNLEGKQSPIIHDSLRRENERKLVHLYMFPKSICFGKQMGYPNKN